MHRRPLFVLAGCLLIMSGVLVTNTPGAPSFVVGAGRNRSGRLRYFFSPSTRQRIVNRCCIDLAVVIAEAKECDHDIKNRPVNNTISTPGARGVGGEFAPRRGSSLEKNNWFEIERYPIEREQLSAAGKRTTGFMRNSHLTGGVSTSPCAPSKKKREKRCCCAKENPHPDLEQRQPCNGDYAAKST